MYTYDFHFYAVEEIKRRKRPKESIPRSVYSLLRTLLDSFLRSAYSHTCSFLLFSRDPSCSLRKYFFLNLSKLASFLTTSDSFLASSFTSFSLFSPEYLNPFKSPYPNRLIHIFHQLIWSPTIGKTPWSPFSQVYISHRRLCVYLFVLSSHTDGFVFICSYFLLSSIRLVFSSRLFFWYSRQFSHCSVVDSSSGVVDRFTDFVASCLVSGCSRFVDLFLPLVYGTGLRSSEPSSSLKTHSHLPSFQLRSFCIVDNGFHPLSYLFSYKAQNSWTSQNQYPV